MPSDEVYRAIESAVTGGEPAVLATVAQTFGSTPRKTGAKMVVREDGSFVGTIGGGCGEAEVWQEAMEVLDGGAA
ncbi:MAG: XdhC family protein, partial [Chloroflexota bacterium]|nr:XdhC family protein [Chloroflexota bacterium]